MKKYDVVGVGYCCVDYLGIVPRYPALDEKVKLVDFSVQGGGITATAMVTVERLGGRASYIGTVGDDDFGAFVIEDLARDGVDTAHVGVQPGAATQFAFIAVDHDTGKRTIFWTTPSVKLSASDIRRDDVVAGRVLHTDAHFPEAAVQAAMWANGADIPVVMDAGSMREGSAELIERTDCLITSALFARQFTGADDPAEAARAMFGGRRKLCAVTMGEAGCVYVTSEGTFHRRAFGVDVVDTTGAGDVFHGAFSFGLSRGWDFHEAIRFASAVAAIKCTKLGGRAGIPSMARVQEFLATTKSAHPE